MKRLKYKNIKNVQPYNWEYQGVYTNEPTDIQFFLYDIDSYFEKTILDIKELDPLLSKCKPTEMLWLNIHGFNEPTLFPELAKIFSVPLSTINEVLSFNRRTRMEEQENLLFFNLKGTTPELVNGKIEIIPISFIIKDNVLLSFQEKRNNFFEHIRERIRTKTGNVRKKKEDYLMFLMLEAIMENFYEILSDIEDEIEIIVIGAKTKYNANLLQIIKSHTENLSDLKRAIAPLRDVLFTINNSSFSEEYQFLEESNHIYFDRLHHKTLELIDQIDYDLNQLDNASSFHFSMQSHRMNEIMKVLTIVSVIFMPLTFIVGVYGMNFENMPELKMHNGYYTVLWSMLLLVLIMIAYFKWRKWF